MSFIENEIIEKQAKTYIDELVDSSNYKNYHSYRHVFDLAKSYIFAGYVSGAKWGRQSKSLSARDRGMIDEIIKALEFLEQDKMLSYADEIEFLNRIRNW